MKTSVIEVRDVLSVLSAQQVEKRMGEVPGVASVTVNDDTGKATVRYDEAKVDIAAIKAAVHRHGQPSASRALPSHARENKPTHAPAESDVPDAAPAPSVAAAPAADAPTPADPALEPPHQHPEPDSSHPKPLAAVSTQAAKAVDPHAGHMAMAASSPSSDAPKELVDTEPSSASPAAEGLVSTVKRWMGGDADSTPVAPAAAGHAGHQGHAKPGDASAMSADMAHEMGHDGMDLAAMVRDMQNRFWICLVFTVPIFIYAPMGGMFEPPAPPFGLDLNLWLLFFSSAAVLYPSWPFFVSAWRGLKKGTLGMAALIVLSVGTGYVFSVASTFFFKKGGQFFEAVSVLLVFILLGHWLEMRARAGASSAIRGAHKKRKFLHLKPMRSKASDIAVEFA
jgi:Cu2+-exporting ATPase